MAVSSPVWMRGAGGWPAEDTILRGRSTEEFDRLDELWDLKWLGDFSEDEASWSEQEPPHHRRQYSRWTSDPALGSETVYSIGKRHPLNCSVDCGELGRTSSSSSLYGTTRTGLLQRVKSWLQHMQDKRRGVVYTNSGPCAMFSDLGIPPYPEDYDWNQ